MSYLKHVLTAAALLLVNACGEAPSDSSRQTSKAPVSTPSNETPQASRPSAAPGAADVKASFARIDGADGQSAFACSYSVNGKTVEGKSLEECDRLKKDFEKVVGTSGATVPASLPAAKSPAGGDNQVACSFNVNGKLYEGKSQAECDKLKKDLGITMNIPTLPATTPVIAPAPGGSTNIACSFNVNGKLYEGKSQAECDKLKKDLGITTTIPAPPAPIPVAVPGNTSDVACAFNINGKLYEGKSQAECDKLKKDLGLQF